MPLSANQFGRHDLGHPIRLCGRHSIHRLAEQIRFWHGLVSTAGVWTSNTNGREKARSSSETTRGRAKILRGGRSRPSDEKPF